MFSEDGLTTSHLHDFVADPAFLAAYDRGVVAAEEDYHIRWRAHIALWAAATAARLPGDFVECGVNRGFLSSAIMHRLDWDSLGKTFWLLDTFGGIDVSILPVEEQTAAKHSNEVLTRNGFYVHGVETVRENFSQWSNVRIIMGSVPTTLAEVTSDKVAYLHLDMNSSTPEIAALEFFWPRLADGAIVLLDDYGFPGAESQHRAMDTLARSYGVPVATLPTGQGLLLKPPR